MFRVRGLFLILLWTACSDGAKPMPSQGEHDASAGRHTAVVAEPDDDAAYVYDQDQLRTYELRLEQADLDAINADPAAEQYVPGTLLFEDAEYPVGVRYKGSIGAFLGCVANSADVLMPSGAKTCQMLSMKVSFDWPDPEGRFFGLKKLQFHAMRNDPSMLKERLVYWLFRQMGVPAPRAVHARLVINGKLEGLFAFVEQIDGRFTRSRFGDGGNGNLYKEVWPMYDSEQVYLDALETNEDENPSGANMVAFAKALEEAEMDALAGVIDRYLDREAILRYWAVDRAVKQDDGPMKFRCGSPKGQGNNPGPFGNHNYYWYEGADSGRFSIITWDVDLSLSVGFFGLGGFGGSKWYEYSEAMNCECPAAGGSRATRPPACDKLLLGLATLLDDYYGYVRELLAGPFQPDSVDARLDAWSAQIAPAVEEQAMTAGQVSVSAWQSGVTSLRSAAKSLHSEMSSEAAAVE